MKTPVLNSASHQDTPTRYLGRRPNQPSSLLLPPARPTWHRRFTSATFVLALTASLLGNGGPFMIKYPGGDPAAKGVLARLDADLKPVRETRLEVVKEDLRLQFDPERDPRGKTIMPKTTTPLVSVAARYYITNRQAETIEVDFGFPILRGVYLHPFSMMPMPDAQVTVNGTNHPRPTLISNSTIYGLLRRKAARVIDQALSQDADLGRLFQAIQSADAQEHPKARQALANHLSQARHWPAGDIDLLLEYARFLPREKPGIKSQDQPLHLTFWEGTDTSLVEAANETSWAVRAIGDQKATQWLTVLAARLDPRAANSYEAIFEAWGGDIRERAVDLKTGQIRPREITLASDATNTSAHVFSTTDSISTLYARVDYLESDKSLSDEQRAAWKSVLKNLPVIFTFAPMNLLHYHVSFPARSQTTVTVSYRQYAYLDTASPRSYQIAYVLHPASLWDSFGPIHLDVSAPEGVKPMSSIALSQMAPSAPATDSRSASNPQLPYQSHTGTLLTKTGELFIGLKVDDWEKAVAAAQPVASAVAVQTPANGRVVSTPSP